MPIFIENRQHLLVDHVKTLLRQSDQAYFALAFVRHSGVNLLRTEMETLIKKGGSISVLFANDFGATDSSAIRALEEIGTDLKFYSDAVSFHPKAYIFKTRNGLWAIVGSSNLSASGLSKGTEWSILLGPDDMDCSPILSEFNRLWNSVSASEVTEGLVSKLDQQDITNTIRETLRKQDQYPPNVSTVSKEEILADGNNYIVRRRPDRLSSWNFQIYDRKVQDYEKRKGANVVVVCDNETNQEKVFVMPFSYLREYILPSSYCDDKGRYLFEINKQTFRFNWRHGIGMDGSQFLVK